MGISAGRYDARKAVIYRQVTDYTHSEPIQTTEVFCRRYIRFPSSARYGVEQIVQQQMQSLGQIIIRMRRDSVSVLIDPTMEIHHGNAVYGIISPQPIMDGDEIEFLCQYKTSSSLYP